MVRVVADWVTLCQLMPLTKSQDKSSGLWVSQEHSKQQRTSSTDAPSELSLSLSDSALHNLDVTDNQLTRSREVHGTSSNRWPVSFPNVSRVAPCPLTVSPPSPPSLPSTSHLQSHFPRLPTHSLSPTVGTILGISDYQWCTAGDHMYSIARGDECHLTPMAIGLVLQ